MTFPLIYNKVCLLHKELLAILDNKTLEAVVNTLT